MESLLAQTLYTTTPLTSYMPLIAIIFSLYLVYKVFIQKDRNMIELMTTQRMLLPVMIFLAFALAPSASLAVFGGLQQAVTFVMQIVVTLLVPLIVVGAMTYVINTIYPEALR